MSGIEILIAATAFLGGYLYLAQRLRQFLQPIRLELVDTAGFLLTRPDIPMRTKQSIEYVLDHMFSLKGAFIIVTLYPVIWMLPRRPAENELHDDLDADCKRAVRDVFRKGVFIIVSNSPITCVLFLLEVFVFGVLLPVRNSVFRTLWRAQAIGDWASTRRNIFQH